MSSRPWFLAAAVAALPVAACHGALPSAPNAYLGAIVPTFTLPSDDGGLVSLPLPGRTTVIEFFSPSCEPCRTAVPALFARRDELERRGAQLYLVGVLGPGEEASDASAALLAWGASTSFLVEHGGASLSSTGVGAVPSTVVIDERGVLRWMAPPEASAADVVAAVP